MSWTPTVIEFTFNHAIVWCYPEEKREEMLQRRGENIGEVTEQTGHLVFIPQPFGVHIVVSAFDGEEQHSLIGTGGHFGHVVGIKHQVDSPIEITDSGYKTDEESWDKLQERWLSNMPDGLREAVRTKLEEVCG